MTDHDPRIRTEAVRMARAAMSRRRFLGRSGAVLAGAAFAPAVLAACGSDSGSSGGGSGGGRSVTISNWPEYISPKSRKAFSADSGIKLTYNEDINDNNEYFAKIRPNLSRDQSIDTDGFVLTDWMASRLINVLEWTQPLVAADFPNKSNLRAALASPTFDPERTYSAPWQSGVAGIAYNLDSTGGKEINTIDDFLAVDGTTSVLSEMRDTIGLFMMADGKDITKPTYADAEPSFDRLQRALSDGAVDSVTGNEYIGDLERGNLAAAIAWSGDVAQVANPSVRFAVPESGGTLWSDNFMIPVTSEKPDLASEFINFFYDPVNAAVLTSFVQYISPVDGVAEELTKLGGEAAALVDNPLVVPTDEFLATLSIFGPLDAEQEERFDERFAQVTGT